MVVKDLVQLYESPVATQLEVIRESHELDEYPPPRLARFIKKSRDGPTPSLSSSHSSTLTGPSHVDSLHNTTSSPNKSHSHLPSSRLPTFRRVENDPEASESLLPRKGRPSGSGVAPAIPASNTHHHHSHRRPIPAQVLFARNAYPISLPKLDQYLASIVPPSFAARQSQGRGDMFPPLEQLAKTGFSLDDLENNSKIPSAWLDRTSIFWTGVTSLVDLLVCIIQPLSPAYNA